MSKVPDGPIRIEILEDKPGAIRFRFVGFPDVFRNPGLGEGFGGKGDILLGGWTMCSAGLPEITEDIKFLFCPGVERSQDDRELVWPRSLKLLRALIAAGNRRLGPWGKLRLRVRAYQRGQNNA